MMIYCILIHSQILPKIWKLFIRCHFFYTGK